MAGRVSSGWQTSASCQRSFVQPVIAIQTLRILLISRWLTQFGLNSSIFDPLQGSIGQFRFQDAS